MKAFLAIALSSILFLGCQPSSSSNSGNNDVREQDGTIVDVTDTSRCQVSNGVVSTNIIENRWEKNLKSKDNFFKFKMWVDIRQDRTTITNICYIKDRVLTASVTSPSNYTNTNLNIFSSVEITSKNQEGDTCTASIKQENAVYYFKGSCLVLIADGQEMVFVPAR